MNPRPIASQLAKLLNYQQWAQVEFMSVEAPMNQISYETAKVSYTDPLFILGMLEIS